ncbi:alpha/beta fold hydrolase [candidate division KSB1 bacterium]
MKRLLLIIIFLTGLGCSEDVSKGRDVLKTGYIELKDSRLYYEEKGIGRPVIMIHGGFLDLRMWDQQFDLLAKKYRVIRYDVRGHGRSGGADSTFIDHDDLHVLVHRLDIDSAAVIGLSMGGQIAADFAIAHPKRVSALILAGPGMSGYNTPKSEEGIQYIKEVSQALNDDNYDKASEIFVRSWAEGPFREPSEIDPAVREKIMSMISGSRTRWDIFNKAAVLDPPAIGRLDEIRCPVLALAGDKDMPDILELVNLYKDSIPGARKVIIPGAAHLSNMEKPEEFNRIVMEFLESIRY